MVCAALKPFNMIFFLWGEASVRRAENGVPEAALEFENAANSHYSHCGYVILGPNTDQTLTKQKALHRCQFRRNSGFYF